MTALSWLKVGGVFAVALVAFVAGNRYAAALYGEDIAALRADYASRTAALEGVYREKERSQAASMAAAWAERDKARADAVDLSADLERVRGEYAAVKRRMSRADASAGDAHVEQAEGGAELVARCSGLLARCVGMAQELSADRDAVRKLTTDLRKEPPSVE